MIEFQWLPGESMSEEKPEEVIFGNGGVILRRNFCKEERQTEEGEPYKVWVYEYAYLDDDRYERYVYHQSAEENNLIQLEANAALYEELLKTQENQQAIMEGLADIYESKEMI